MYDSTSLESKKNGNGVVHGHIHNYNNLTYIHGHVHHNALETDLSDFNRDAQSQLEPPQQNNTTTNGNYHPNLSHSDCKPFEFFDFHNNGNVLPFSTIQLDQVPSYNNNTQSKRKFEELDDNMLSQMVSRSKKTSTRTSSDNNNNNNHTISTTPEDDCTPKVFEICCDLNHDKPESQNKNTSKMESLSSIPADYNSNLIKNDNIPPNNPNCLTQNLPNTNTKQTSNSLMSQNNMKFLSDLNCNFDCDFDCNTATNNTSTNTTINDSNLIPSSDSNSNNGESDFFDRYCQLCDTDEPHDQHVYDSENTPITSTSKTMSSTTSTKSLDTAINNHLEDVKLNQDMKILEDLCNISSLYEVPFAQHMSHHHQQQQQINGNNNNLEEKINGNGERNSTQRAPTQNHRASNLLEPVIRSQLAEKLQKSDSNESNGNLNLHDHAPHHHHHKIELHTHVPMINNPTILEDSKTKQTILNNAINFHVDTKMDHDDGNKNIIPDAKSETMDSFNTLHSHNKLNELNTINFNWNFKRDEENDMKCLWNDCQSGTGFNNLIDLQKHMFVDHVPETKNTDFACHWQDCLFEGNDVCSLVNHINDQHGINFGIKINEPDSTSHVSTHTTPTVKEEEEQQSDESQSIHECQWDGCILKFGSLRLLNEHIETEHIPKRQHNYVCHWHDCNKTFSQRQKLLRHIKVHTGYKPYRCKICDRTFANQETLIQHNRTHSGEKPYKCDICGKCFGGSSSLKIHIRTHTGEKPLKCPICDKRFNESSNLNKHLKTHTKKFSCDHCGRKFATAKTLNAHVTSGGCQDKQSTQIPVGKA